MGTKTGTVKLPVHTRVRVTHEPGDVDWSDAEREEQANRRLEVFRVEYSIDKNPVFAWAAYSISREFGVAIPDWVWEYLDLAAWNLTSLQFKGSAPSAGKIAPMLAGALGFVPGGVESTWLRSNDPTSPESRREKTGGKPGPFNPFADRVRNQRDHRLANTVRRYLLVDKLELPDAIKRAATLHKVGAKMVSRAVDRFGLDTK